MKASANPNAPACLAPPAAAVQPTHPNNNTASPSAASIQGQRRTSASATSAGSFTALRQQSTQWLAHCHKCS